MHRGRSGILPRMKRTTLLLAVAGFALTAAAQEPAAITTVILVRHAEKIADPVQKDPELSEAGRARAAELLRVLGTTPVDAIFTTPYHRTRSTAKPFAEARKLTPVEIAAAGGGYAEEVVARIRRDHNGGTVLVVGHSNTTEQVIRALGIADAPHIEESAYDNLFIVTLAPGAEPRLVSLRYGKEVR